jgi:hypothetical protein
MHRGQLSGEQEGCPASSVGKTTKNVVQSQCMQSLVTFIRHLRAQVACIQPGTSQELGLQCVCSEGENTTAAVSCVFLKIGVLCHYLTTIFLKLESNDNSSIQHSLWVTLQFSTLRYHGIVPVFNDEQCFCLGFLYNWW